ncbi:uncharacterized protein LOC123666782 [Melitaea cinxia]|uniref:uncharacterized protein LOC123666782 n=1 Tax=Melitaea cinxia TaxID=113334 RepID=UPI001E270EB4|nr:uncharacterized protein LOC123666782 [Melitaea cinxia]
MTARKRTMDIINKALHSSNIEFLPRRVLNFDIPEPDQANVWPLDHDKVENDEPVSQSFIDTEALDCQTVAQSLPRPCITEIEMSLSSTPTFSATADHLPSTSFAPEPKMNNNDTSNLKKKT